MAENTWVNRVELADGFTLLDISEDTVTEDKVLSGYKAHMGTGEPIVGTFLSVGETWSTDQDVAPESVLGFGTWELIRTVPFTWSEASQYAWSELKEDTWAHDNYRPCVYVWIRTA